MYPATPIIVNPVRYVCDKLLNEAIEYWCNNICRDIARYKDLTTLTVNYQFASNDEAEKWISKIYKTTYYNNLYIYNYTYIYIYINKYNYIYIYINIFYLINILNYK